MAAQRTFKQVVVVGASAGGIDALSRVVAGIPAGFPAPIVVAQHIDPHRTSHLREILQRRTELQIVSVETEELLEPGVLYVVPANRNVEISDSSVAVVEDHGERPMPSVDLLLRTAATAFGENLIAVILSGAGSDGAAGARAVKIAGGAVVIQDPDTAGFASMPASVAPTMVDVIANADAIGPLLLDLVTADSRTQGRDDRETLALLLDRLRERSGIDFERYKRPTILRRLERRMAAVGSRDISAYLAYLEDRPEEYQRLVSAFLIKVTEFFRDGDLFELLRTRIVPDLIAEAKAAGRRTLRVWSAGCATGEEAYSLAMVIADALGDELDRWTVRVFATDVDEEAVAFARRGIYAPTTVEALPPQVVESRFSRLDGSYLVNKAIRGLVVFGHHDLAMRAPFPRVDLVLCRNVLIYFTPDLQRRALQLFAFSLRDRGVLVLGKAESTSRLATSFVLEDARLKVYRRQGERSIVPPARAVAPPPARLRRHQPAERQGRPRSAADASTNVLARLPVGVVEVDANYDVRAINQAARNLIGIHGIAEGKDFVHLARNLPANELRELIDGALAGLVRSAVLLTVAPGAETSERIPLAVTARPMPARPGGGAGVLVLVDDASVRETPEGDAEEQRRAGLTSMESLNEHARRLADTNRTLRGDNEELSLSNASLRSDRDQLLVAAEEAQAGAEEVETLNEELQATNEELETLNEELQATNEELNTTNDDLEARQRELEQLAASLVDQQRLMDQERGRLAAVLTGLTDAIVVLDDAGAATLQNDAYAVLSALEDSGHQGEPGGEPGPIQRLRRRLAAGESFDGEVWIAEIAGSRHWFEAYGHPVLLDGAQHGRILVIRDITERSLRAQQTDFVAVAAHELRTPLTALRGYLQLLNRDADDQVDPARRARYMALTLDQAERLRHLVTDLFETARVDAGKLTFSFTDVDLAELLAQTAEVARPIVDDRQLRVDRLQPGIIVSGDPGRLQQVVLNLISNAATHAPSSAQIEVELAREGGDAVIRVVDHGPGIPADEVASLFSRYRQGRGGSGSGLGLGLYISREIVQAHRGHIEVTTTPGGGATMVVRLPLASGERDDRSRRNGGRQGSAGTKRSTTA